MDGRFAACAGCFAAELHVSPARTWTLRAPLRNLRHGFSAAGRRLWFTPGANGNARWRPDECTRTVPRAILRESGPVSDPVRYSLPHQGPERNHTCLDRTRLLTLVEGRDERGGQPRTVADRR